MKNVFFVIVQFFCFNYSYDVQIFMQIVILFDDLIDNCLLIKRVDITHTHVVR